MRNPDSFRHTHAKLVRAALARDSEDDGELRNLGLVELCLHFLARHLSRTEIDAGPYLLLGYHGLVRPFAKGGAVLGPLANLRHLASRLASIAAWEDALRAHSMTPAAARCYDVADRLPVRRRTASPTLLASLDGALDTPVPWTGQFLRVAEPGEYRVRSNSNQSVLSYKVPPVAVPSPERHAFQTRPTNPPITLSKADLQAAAAEADAREAAPGWPQHEMKPLGLAKRLVPVRIEGARPGFWDSATERLTLDGVTHLVGMLSSGKSTLVWALLFALARGRRPYRVAVLATDTVGAAALVARLRLHGVRATVLSSATRRERHLEGIHWQQKMHPGGATLASAGGMSDSFGTACPLDGFQHEAKVIQGVSKGGSADFPTLKEKPCHALTPVSTPISKAERGDGTQGKREDPLRAGDSERGNSCPFWSRCPIQSQQREAVAAEVIAITPEAFAHMSPDRWVSDRRVTIPELLQFTADVVIVDEVDAVQKRLDGVFSPLSSIMGDERDMFAPFVGRQTSEALRKRSGAQFRNPVNTRWQSNFFNFFRLVGILYSLVQAEDELRPFFGNGPFTAGSLLYELRRLKLRRNGEKGVPGADFLKLVSVAFGIARSAMPALGDEEGVPDHGAPAATTDPGFDKAAKGLSRIASAVLAADHHLPPLGKAQQELDEAIEVFDAVGGALEDGHTLSQRGNALVILLAVVSDLVLWHYHWLVRSQPVIAGDLGMEDGALFGAAANLGRHYRTLLPSNPAGSLFGLQYDAPKDSERGAKGGRLTLVNHLGVGRHLICHLHDLLLHEGQAGPHVLLLSGTSWAGGTMRRTFKSPNEAGEGIRAEVASPIYDVQVPVKGVLCQPDEEVGAVARSVFRLVPLVERRRDRKVGALRASGLPQPMRRASISMMAARLAARQDRGNRFEETWDEMERLWRDGEIADRRRAMLVVNSYADAAAVAGSLSSTLAADRSDPWQVRCLVPDREDPETHVSDGLEPDERLPRSLVERFGELPERSVLVAPLGVVARGHNILNGRGKAAISSIWFLHRPHPRPDDLSATVGRLNRYATRRFDHDANPAKYLGLADCARRMRWDAAGIVREAMDNRGGFSALPRHLKASFAWDMLTPLWQTIGRGIRGGVPVFVGFVDRQFAPARMDGTGDDPTDGSALLQAIHELEAALNEEENPDHAVATRLYAPFLETLRRTEGLH